MNKLLSKSFQNIDRNNTVKFGVSVCVSAAEVVGKKTHKL